MLKKIEALIFGGRWRRDEYAWRAWQEIEPLIPARLPMLGRKAGDWEEQRARRGNKALVDFGSVIGTQDTWWEHMRPPVGHWVIVHAHLWLPPGTHSGYQVLWIDRWESWAAGDTPKRARRHKRRVERGAARQGAEQIEIGQPPSPG